MYTLYNASNQEKIGIFAAASLAARYLYDKYDSKKPHNIYNSLIKKSRICNSRFPFKVAVRHSTKEDKELLSDNEYVTFIPYPVPSHVKMRGFTSTRRVMYLQQCK